MPAHKIISREYRIYLALWRKALNSPEGAPTISIKCPNLHSAVAMRQSMYRAIKPFRAGTQSDSELQKAADKFVLYLVQAEKAAEPHFIEFRERKSLTILEAAWDSLGIDEEDLLVGDERSITEKLHELMDKVPDQVRKTAFYEREE
jgi:hypothetical protein